LTYIDGMEMNWKKMGFKSEKEYKVFLDQKMKDLLDKIKNDPKLLNVFKRLNDK
jgi:hypothetical protein